MSKAKEALESIMLRAKEGRNKEQQKYIESNYELVKQSLDELEELKKKTHILNFSSDDEYAELKKALTPPTSDEVCEALSEYYKKTVYYTDFYIDKGFVLQWYKNKKSSRDMKLVSGNKYRLGFYRELPPRLVTMISRFYESESEKDV